MRPSDPPPRPRIDFDKCVLYKDGNAPELEYWLVAELKFRAKFHKIHPETGDMVMVAALWEHFFPGEILNSRKAIIIEFEDPAGMEYLTTHLPNRAASFAQFFGYIIQPTVRRN